MINTQGQENFEFELEGAGTKYPFVGYVSSVDKTSLNPGVLIRGSKNVYQKVTGTIASRFGLKRRGIADGTSAGVKGSYEWQSSRGMTLPLRVCDGKLEVESKIADSINPLWYELLDTSGNSLATSLTNFSFDTWWENLETKDRLLMVRGDHNILHWAGGITKIDSVTTQTGGITPASLTIATGGSGYTNLQIIKVNGGTSDCILRVHTTGDAVSGFDVISLGAGYSTGSGVATSYLTGTAGTGFTVNIGAVQNTYSIKKLDTSTTWQEDGFCAMQYQLYDKYISINGHVYFYSGGETTDTLTGISTDPSGEASGSIAFSAVIASNLNSWGYVIPANYNPTFLKVLNNQVLLGSSTSKILYLSANSSSGTSLLLGFQNYVNTGALVAGDPDWFIIDNPPIGMGAKNGVAYVSAGTSDWYIVTPNTPIPVAVADHAAPSSDYIMTKVQKIPSAGLSAALGHQFIDNLGDDLIYLDQNHQLRAFGTFRNIVTPKFPSLSLQIKDELQNVDFTGGHLRVVDDIIYITAPNQGTHYMLQVLDELDNLGNITTKRIWHPPQISNIARIAVIDGVTYGHSNANPQIYQIWDTGQWFDDCPTDEEINYICVARFAYRNHGRRQGLLRFDKVYYEGYISSGTALNANTYLDYIGASGVYNSIINSNNEPAKEFDGTPYISLGDSPLGTIPLGEGIVQEVNEQELLPKFRAIIGVTPTDCFEYALEVYSIMPNSRWEILCLGTNATLSTNQAVFIKK